MKENKGAIYMEPEEYEAYLKEQERLVAEAQAKAKELAESGSNELTSVSLYELNQGIINGMPALSGDEVLKRAQLFFDWVAENKGNYYMLLNNELHYYTIFHNHNHAGFPDDDPINIDDFWSELLDTLKYAGTIKEMEVDTNGAWSIWIDWHNQKTCHCFYLFPYDEGVVEV